MLAPVTRHVRDPLAVVAFAALLAACSGGGATAPGSPPTQPSGAAAAAAASAVPTASPTPVATPTPTAAPTPGVATIAAVESGAASVVVEVSPYPGAADYRVYDVANPARTVYGGPATGPDGRARPNRRLVWDGLAPGHPVTLAVDAVDAPGPFPLRNLSSGAPPLGAACMGAEPGAAVPARPGAAEGAVGATGIARGGLGCPASVPNVVARSVPFTVSAANAPALPSSPQARGVAVAPLDPRTGATLLAIVPPNAAAGTATYTFGAPPDSWTVLVDGADTARTSLALSEGTFDDVLFDGASPAAGGQPHTGHASVAIVPNEAIDLSGGAIVHTTFTVNAHGDAHRGIGIALSPASAPLSAFYPDDGDVDAAGQAIFIDIASPATGAITVEQVTAPHPAAPLVLAAPGAGGPGGVRGGADDGPNARERFDAFVSTTRFALFENGERLVDGAFPAPLGFTAADVYFVHDLAGSAQDAAGLRASGRDDAWARLTPFSDERRWTDVGVEVLPASTPWSAIPEAIRLPQREAPRR